jgi:hypothetical protein
MQLIRAASSFKPTPKGYATWIFKYRTSTGKANLSGRASVQVV